MWADVGLSDVGLSDVDVGLSDVGLSDVGLSDVRNTHILEDGVVREVSHHFLIIKLSVLLRCFLRAHTRASFHRPPSH